MSLPMPRRVPEPGFYYHYKHDPTGPLNNYAYEVMGVGFHTEDDARVGESHFVVYRPLYDAFVYKASKELGIPCFDNRPLEMWMGDVEKDGTTMSRFRKITDAAVIAELEKIRAEMYEDSLPQKQSIGEAGQALYETFQGELESRYPNRDTYVVINVARKEYLVGLSHHDAIARYQEKFGDEPSYMRGIGFLDIA